MTPAPGYTVTIGDTPANNFAAAAASNAFFVGGCERGPLDDVQLVVSLADFVNKCGGRIEGFPTLYDSLDAFFREGGAAAYISREVGSSAAAATKNATDSESKKAIIFTAYNKGAWGNGIKVAITNSSNKLTGTVKLDGETVLSFSEVAGNAALIALVNEQLGDEILKAADGGESAAAAKTQEITLTGGTDALNAVTTETLETALANHAKDLGPGQVLAPGRTAEAVQKALMAHANTNNRRAIIDTADEVASEVVADAAALDSEDGARFACMVAPWAKIPGLTRNTERTIPYSPILAGQIARAEGLGYSPNEPAAGNKRGSCEYAIGLTRAFTDAELANLNDGGVIAAKLVRGTPTTFGNVTLVDQDDDPDWKSFSASRTIMVAAGKAGEVLENYEFETIDGHGYVFRKLQGDLSNIACMPLYQQNALYGTTPEEAFAVNTGPDVNTPASIAAEEIKAQIALRVSPTGERLEVEIVKVPTTDTL